MPAIVVVGAQWGDEGKGKVVDLYSEQADMVVRYGGGANAGHTLVIDGQTLITHLIPSGVLRPDVECVLGDGMVIDLDTLLEEIDACKQRGLLDRDQLTISRKAHVILPYHRWLEGARETGDGAIGTTRRGIGPAYESKAGRTGLRMVDIGFPERVRHIIERNLDELGPRLTAAGHRPEPGDIDSMVEAVGRAADKLGVFIGEAGRAVDRAIASGKNVLFEGAQGTLLDVDHGTYPFVTSSSTIAGGACTGVGIGPTRIDQVVGISKAYCTRVGGGPFPTEMDPATAEAWRTAGAEFGATTGRPRRCGWLDASALRMAVRLNGLDGIALTKLDVLGGHGPIQICTGYRLDGTELDEPPPDAEALGRAQPIYQELEGWDQSTREARSVEDLPPAARTYMRTLEDLVGAPLWLVSVGPDRAETVILRRPFEL